MNDITVIIPVNDVSGEFKNLFTKCIKSLEEQVDKPKKILVVHAAKNDIIKFFEEWEKPENLDVDVLFNSGDSSFSGQINFGVDNIETDWFSVLEFDDEYSKIWFKNVQQYIDYYEDVDLFFPLVVETSETNEFLGFTNEALWAMGFSEKMGDLDNNTLLNYQNFQTSGMVMRSESFRDIGGLKSNIKLTFSYEFLLRATYNDIQIMTVPKVGYKHTNMREHSLFWDYKNHPKHKLSPNEAKFWVDTAKKEYFFTQDRPIKYQTTEA